MYYWPSTNLKEYEEANGLHEPLIIPSFIPRGYQQSWNPYTRSYYLTPINGIMNLYKRKHNPMDAETNEEVVVEAPETAPEAPESVPEAEVEETPVETETEAVEAE